MPPAEKPLANHARARGQSEHAVKAGELLRLRAELLQAKKLSAVGELAANVAHEVNNVLTVVMGQAQLLLLGSLPDEATERVQKLYSEACQGARIVQSLLHFARCQPNPRRAMGVADLVSRVLDLMHYRLQAEHIRLVTDLQPVSPVEADGPQLQQVIFNLVQNAQQAMTAAHGGGTLTVRTHPSNSSEEGAPDFVRIEVEDDGPGIPREVLGQIFDPFFTTKSAGEGAGLGLSISREIVVDHGGRIWAENQPSGGTGFFIELPLLKNSKRRSAPHVT